MDRSMGFARVAAQSRLGAAVVLLAGIALSPAAAALQADEVFAGGFEPTASFYVAKNGEDTWSGTLPAPNAGNTDGPFATFDRARAAVAALDKTGLERVFVEFRSGNYALTAAEEFTSADTGSASTEIVYRNYAGESAVISGGVRVRNWVNVSGNIWQTNLPLSTQYFETLYYNGDRRLRPRLGGYLGAYHRIWNTVTLPVGDPTLNSSCPANDSYECFDRFDYNPVFDASDPTSLDPADWGNLVPADGNLCGQTAGIAALQGDIEILVFEQFSTSKLRVSCADTVNHRIYLTGPTAIPGPNNASQAGFIQGNRIVVENVRNALTEPGQWFLDRSASPWVLTYLAEPGEDPNADVVVAPQAAQLIVANGVQYVTLRGLTFEYDNYVVPPAGHASSELEPEVTSALSFQNSSHVRIDGVIVRHASGGGLDFISCLKQQDGSGNTVSPSWCTAYNLAATTAANTIVNSAVFDVGAAGIRIGENTSNNALVNVTTYDNVPYSFVVQNNVVSGYGRLIPAAFGIGQGVGHDNLYTHNDVYDGYHCAISISHGGGDTTAPNGLGNAYNTISFNHVHDLLQGIMNDGGSIRIEAGNGVFTSPGNRIANNIIHDTSDASALDNGTISGIAVRPGYGGNGIYMDNSTGLVDVENNLVYRVSGSAIYSPHGPQNSSPAGPQNFGQANYVHNNILAFARHGMFAVNNPYYSQSGPSYVANPVFLATNNLMYFDRDELSAPPFYAITDCTYSANLAYASFEGFQDNLYWRTNGTFAADPHAFHVQPLPTNGGPCSKNDASNWDFYYFDAPFTPSWLVAEAEDSGSVVQDPNFTDPAYPSDDFSLSAGAPVTGFVPFDLTAPGRTNASFTPPVVAPTFVTAPFDPATDF